MLRKEIKPINETSPFAISRSRKGTSGKHARHFRKKKVSITKHHLRRLLRFIYIQTISKIILAKNATPKGINTSRFARDIAQARIEKIPKSVKAEISLLSYQSFGSPKVKKAYPLCRLNTEFPLHLTYSIMRYTHYSRSISQLQKQQR